MSATDTVKKALKQLSESPKSYAVLDLDHLIFCKSAINNKN